MNRFIVIFSIAMVFVYTGCATERAHSRFQISGSSYSIAVEKRLRTAKLYRQFDTILIVDAILNDMWLQNAWVEKQADINRWSDEKKGEVMASRKNEGDKNVQFIVALYTSGRQWNDLANPDSRWSVFLESDGGSLGPESIDKVSLERLPMRDNLSFHTKFRTFYRINFPQDKAGQWPYRLVMSSDLGEVKLTWSRP